MAEVLACSLSVVGVLVIPGIVVAGIIALPFLDRSVERRPWKRPTAMTAYAFVALSLIGLGMRSHYSDQADAGVAQQLVKQDDEEETYMSKPFEPELSSAPSPPPTSRSATPWPRRVNRLRGPNMQRVPR